METPKIDVTLTVDTTEIEHQINRVRRALRRLVPMPTRRLSRPAWKRTGQERRRMALRKEARHRKRLLIVANRKNPPMFGLQPLSEPKRRKLGIGEPLRERRAAHRKQTFIQSLLDDREKRRKRVA